MRELVLQEAANLGLEKFAAVVEFFYKILLCLIAVCIGHIVLKLCAKFLKKALIKKTEKSETTLTVCSSILKYFVYFCVTCQILLVFGISPASILAVAGVGSVALGLGAQDLVGDIISGIFILIEEQYAVGDVIKIDSYQGTVESIGLKTTKLRSYDGDVYIIPNGEIKIVTNCCKNFNRAVLDISVAYEHNTEYVIDVLTDELDKIYKNGSVEGFLKPPEVLGVTDLGDSGVTIRISADTEAGKQWSVERGLRLLIKKRFDEENIIIPYPQRTVHITDENGLKVSPEKEE